MSRHAPPGPHSAEHWDERYAGDRIWSGNPNEALVAEVASLTPGRVLDVGCGEGADSVWLAQQGWQVTELPPASYDLVSAMYPALLRTPDRAAEQRLLDLVAPGGTLLVVHHADVDREHALEHGFDPDDYVSPDDVRALAADQGWDVEVDERRARHVAGGAGAHHTHDLVVRLVRR